MKKYDEDIPPGNSWGESRNFYPADQRLRKNGFKIHARPRVGPAVWQFADNTFTEQEALEFCERSEKQLVKTG